MPEGKVITVLKHRREIDAAMAGLVSARTEEDSRPYLLALAGYGSDVLPVLLTYLDTPDPWVVRALGRVFAQVDDHDRAGRFLRRAILSPKSSDRRRIVAMVLLDQFLGQSLDDALFAALGNSTDVAVRALLKERGPDERIVRLDYLSIIQAQPPAEVCYALEQFQEAGGRLAVEALCFFALDERDTLAQLAIEALGSLREPVSLQALCVLEPNVSSSHRPLVERMVRKLLLSGVPDRVGLESPAGSRVLISPIDGAGNRLILFLFPHEEGYRALHLFLDDEEGIRGTYEVILPVQDLPQPAPVGTVLPAPHPWEGIYLLEGTCSYARRLLRIALDCNEAHNSLLPLEYRFFCDQIWGWTVLEEAPPAPPLSRGAPVQTEVAALLGHSFISSWFLESVEIYEAAQGLLGVDLGRPGGPGRLSLATVILVQTEFPEELCQKYAGRLWDTVEWLLRAEEMPLAEVAMAAAEELETVPPLQSAFALMLMQKSLLIAVEQVRQD